MSNYLTSSRNLHQLSKNLQGIIKLDEGDVNGREQLYVARRAQYARAAVLE